MMINCACLDYFFSLLLHVYIFFFFFF